MSALTLVFLIVLLAPMRAHSDVEAKGGKGFEDVTVALGLSYPVRNDLDEEEADTVARHMEAGGLALVDIDEDGSLELYVAHAGGEKGRLFSYDGSRFVGLPGNRGIEPAAIDLAGYFVDLDQDGHVDFVSINSEGPQTFRNDGSGQFAPTPGPLRVQPWRNTHSMAAADYDNDGDLDLFFAHWLSLWNKFKPPSHYLWRNNGRGRYEDVSHIVPIRPGSARLWEFEREVSFTPTFADIDADGDPDILLASDFRTSQILRNEDGKGFTDIASHVLTDENGMGAAVFDVDRDGDLDWFVTSINKTERINDREPTGNRLYLNVGGADRFVEVSRFAGVREGGWGWGACAADFDNDGHADLFHTNGWFESTPSYGSSNDFAEFEDDRSRLFMSNGDGTFSERSSAFGIDHSGQGRGVVCADYDGDGRVDIFIANHGAAPTVYANRIDNANHWLAIDLAGQFANPQAVGARVVVHTASASQTQEVRLGTGYLSQGPPTLHFGLGPDVAVTAVEVRWPGPGGQLSRLENVEGDRRVVIRQPAPEGVLLSVVRGSGSGLYAGGEPIPIEADAARGHYRFSHWSAEGGGQLADARSPQTSFTMPAGPATVFAHFLPGPSPTDPSVSVARRWIDVLLQAIRDDFARPTVHARNLFHLSAAMYDAWAAWSTTARPYLFGDAGDADAPCSPPSLPLEGDIRAAQEEAISHAAWRLIRHRFRHSPGLAGTERNADTLMSALGHDRKDAAAAALGRCIGEHYIARGLADGSNEPADYASTVYRPVNRHLDPQYPGDAGLSDPDRWQPLALRLFIDQAGNPADGIHEFVTPEWGRVTPFALSEDDLTVHERDGADWLVYHDPGPPPTLGGPHSELYKWGFALVARWSAALSPDNGVVLDIAPSGIGNIDALPRRMEDHPGFYDGNPHGPGRAINPVTGRAYEPQPVPRGDYTRVLAEFWADGPDSETPPGHWFVILNAVNDHEKLARRIGGAGPVLNPLEWDVKAYFALGGAMHDAAIAAWGIKGWYDYIRPISALRAMAGRGQSSDPELPSWSPDGIPLIEGFIELVDWDDPFAGGAKQHAGKIKLRAWRGPDHVRDPATDAAGVGWILAENWWPYQRPTFVTPPFAGYVSGHSTYSRAAAEVLTALTGDPFFPGGMSEFRIPANDFLVFERGPSVDMTLQWATYRDAADQCSLSRIWGGIHPPADDIPGRLIGARIGRDAVRLAASHF